MSLYTTCSSSKSHETVPLSNSSHSWSLSSYCSTPPSYYSIVLVLSTYPLLTVLWVLINLFVTSSIALLSRSIMLCLHLFIVIQSEWQQKPLECPTWAVDWCEHCSWYSPSISHHPPTAEGQILKHAMIYIELVFNIQHKSPYPSGWLD
jgi:hypothetical protein